MTLGKFTFCVKVTMTFNISKKVDMFPNVATECKIIDRLQAYTIETNHKTKHLYHFLLNSSVIILTIGFDESLLP